MAVDRTERGLNGMDIVKVSIMGICGMMLGFILKETRPEFAALVTMMTGFLILGLAAGKVSYLFETMNRLRESFPGMLKHKNPVCTYFPWYDPVHDR